MVRIGILLDSLVGGGAERMSLNFAEKFRDMGHDPHVFILRDDIQHDSRDVVVHRISDSLGFFSWKPIRKLQLAFRLKNKIREIEKTGEKFYFFISNAEDMDRISKIARLENVIVRYRNSMCEYLFSKVGQKSGWKRFIREYRWKKKFQRIYGGQNIVAISERMRLELLNECKIIPKSIDVIYNPFNFKRIREFAEYEDGDIPSGRYVLYVARFSERKDQETLLRAFSRISTDLNLVLLGGVTSPQEESYRDYIQKLVHSLGLSERVLMPGFKKNPYPWIKRAAIFAMSSRSEGLPLVLIESLILGTPVVSTDCPTGPSEILVRDLQQFLSPVGDDVALASNILRALDDYPAIDSSYIEKFDDNVVARKYIEHAERISIV